MLIQQKIGNLGSMYSGNRPVDWLQLEWYETHKRVLRKRTQSGRELSLKFLKEDPAHGGVVVLACVNERVFDSRPA